MIHSVSVIRLSVRVMYDSLRRQVLINALPEPTHHASRTFLYTFNADVLA